MNRFLHLLTEWAQNFPNDFRKKSTWTTFYLIREKCLVMDPGLTDAFDNIALYLASKVNIVNLIMKVGVNIYLSVRCRFSINGFVYFI